MLVVLMILGLVAAFLTAQVVSLYSLAVYLDPEEVESLFAGVSRRRRRLLKRLAGDPRAFVQIAAIYKAFALIAGTALGYMLLKRLADVTGIASGAVVQSMI